MRRHGYHRRLRAEHLQAGLRSAGSERHHPHLRGIGAAGADRRIMQYGPLGGKDQRGTRDRRRPSRQEPRDRAYLPRISSKQ